MTMGRYDGMDENKGSAWAVCTARGCEEPRGDVCIKLDHNTMITLITTQWSHYSHPSDDFDHNSKLINLIVTFHNQFDQDCNQITKWPHPDDHHHPSLSCTSRSNLGWPYLTQVLGAASQQLHLPIIDTSALGNHAAVAPLHALHWMEYDWPTHWATTFFRYWDLCFFLHILTMQGYLYINSLHFLIFHKSMQCTLLCSCEF